MGAAPGPYPTSGRSARKRGTNMRTRLRLGLVVVTALLVACGPSAGAGTSGSGPSPSNSASTSPPAGAGSASPGAPAGGPPSAVVQAAAQEGTLELYTPSSLEKTGAAQIVDAFNRHYGLHVDFNYPPSGSMTRDAARVVTEISAGQAPTWDVMLVTDAHYATLFNNGALEKIDWAGLGLADPSVVTYDGTALNYATQFVAPAYNPNIVSAGEAPKDWNDLLDPKWHGKIGVSTATHHWARLAQAWGDERTTSFMESLNAQQPTLGRLPELYTRLTLGEISVYASITDSYANEAKQTGAPFTFVTSVKPLIATNYSVGVLKGVKRPNLAKLFAVFMTTPEAQTIWDQQQGQTSMFIQGTPAWQYVQGKDVVALDAKYAADQLEDLTEKYGRIVGYR
jgi:iron(III) transport system substrate-binding protein